VQLFHITIR